MSRRMEVFFESFEPEPDSENEPTEMPDEEVAELRYGFQDRALGRYRVRTHEEYHERGIEISNWVQDPNLPNCPITATTLTPAQMSEMTDGESRHMLIDDESIEETLVLPPGLQPRPWIFWAGCVIGTSLEGFYGNGAMIIDIMTRPRGSSGPHISEVAAVRYAAEYPIEGLRYIFITSVVNREFKHYMKLSGLDEVMLNPGRTFEHGSTEYFGIMGTRVGRVVGSILLAALPRGTRRVSSIHLWKNGWAPSMRFDVEEI